jgi:hypothetical protein
MAPRKTTAAAVTPEYTLENFNNSGWYMHTWYEHRFYNHTFVMILPVEEPHLCRFLVRVDIHGAGTATSMTGTRMPLSSAVNSLESFYRKTEIVRPIHFGTQV